MVPGGGSEPWFITRKLLIPKSIESLKSQKPIRIIVRNGQVTLEGVVDSEADKNLVGVRANTVPGLFSLTNNLRVVPSLFGKYSERQEHPKRPEPSQV
jgi:BON domain